MGHYTDYVLTNYKSSVASLLFDVWDQRKVYEILPGLL